MKKIHHVTVWVSQSAPLCSQTKDYFREAGIEPDVVDITHDPIGARTMFEKSGQMIPPVTEIDGRIIIGYRPDMFEILIAQPDKKKGEQ